MQRVCHHHGSIVSNAKTRVSFSAVFSIRATAQRLLKPYAVLAISFALALVSKHALAQQAADFVQPEYGTQSKQTQMSSATVTPVVARDYIAVTAHPIATDAAAQVLDADGHVMDAFVVTQAMLGLVEPQSSGLGGGAFVLYFDAKTRKLSTFDGRETAPMAATESLFLNAKGEPLGFFEAVVGGRSVGTPGTVKLMHALHQRFGKHAWPALLAPAITQAETGFAVSPRLAASIARDAERLRQHEVSAAYFLPQDRPLQTGDVLTNSAYAATLKQLAKHGADVFYQGELAEAIVNTVRNAPNPGVLAKEDLARYQVIERPPICFSYRDHDICSMGPPSSGAHTIGQILGITEHFDLAEVGPESAEAWHIISEAARLAFADRGRYLADSDFEPVPSGLLDTAYLKQRAALISRAKAQSSVAPGKPSGIRAAFQSGANLEQPSTTHFVLVDKAGNILSVTSTIENAFGSRLMVGGFLLNNELTDFSFAPTQDGLPVANRVAPGKRPRSSMAPVIAFRNHEPWLAIGSPGGSRIINYVANSLIRLIDWQQPLAQVVAAPHVVSRFGTIDLEQGTAATGLAGILEKLGHQVAVRDLNSGIHAVRFADGLLTGASDPRREGTAKGD